MNLTLADLGFVADLRTRNLCDVGTEGLSLWEVELVHCGMDRVVLDRRSDLVASLFEAE